MSVKVKKILIAILFSFLFVTTLVLEFYQLSKEKEKYKDYTIIEGEYESASIYAQDEDGITYSLTYRYYVRGEWYTITSNSGTSLVPSKGTLRKIRYLKENPSKAMIVGVELSELCLLAVLITFLFSFYYWSKIIMERKNNEIKKRLDSLFIIFVGLFIIYGSCLIYKLITGTKNIFTIFDFFPSYGVSLLLVLVFTFVGIYIVLYTIYSFFPKKKIKKSAFEIEQAKLRREELEKNVDLIVERATLIGIYAKTIIRLMLSGFVFFILVRLFYIKNTNIDSIFLAFTLPFVVTVFSMFFMSLLDVIYLFLKQDLTALQKKRREILKKIGTYIPIIAFLLFLFSFLIIFVKITLEEKQWIMTLFTIPFWLIGFYIIVSIVKKGK